MWVDFDFKIPGINFPQLEANITVYPDDVPAAVKKSRVLTASLRAVTHFGFTYAGIDAEVSTMVATLTVFDKGRIEGSITAMPSLTVGDGGGTKVNIDMVIIANFWMDRGGAFNMDAELSVEASLDIEDRFFGIHLSGGASTTCQPEGLNLQGTFWFMIPGVIDSRLDGRGLHSSTFRLNVSAFYGIEVHLGGLEGMLTRFKGVCEGVIRVNFASETAQIQL